jgi:hypothetical protein
MMKKHMTLPQMGGNKGQVVQNQGKGSRVQTLSAKNNVSNSGSAQPDSTLNNYAKASPAAAPTPPAPDGLGSGSWPGIGS